MSMATSRTIAPSLSPVSTRLASLDIFRGVTVAFMLLVNNGGAGTPYAPLEHAEWNHGFTPTDLVFPFFLFIMGVAIPFSMGKRSATESKGEQFLHVLTRGLSLFLLGEFIYSQPYLMPGNAAPMTLRFLRWFALAMLFGGYALLLYPWKSKRKLLLIPPIVAVVYLLALVGIHYLNVRAGIMNGIKSKSGYGLFDPDTLRIPGILQRIGVCYVVAASLALVFSWHALVVVVIALLAMNTWLMLWVWYPSVMNPAHLVRGLLLEKDNLARFVDVRVLGKHVYGSYPDPEGIVSSITAVATSVMGILVGVWLRTARPAAERCSGLLSWGVLVASVGWLLGVVLLPINKSIYTPSYCVLCSGLAMLGLGMAFYFADVLQFRGWGWPFKVFGMNAIAAFVFSGIVGRLLLYFKISNPRGGEAISVRAFLSEHAATLSRQVHFGVASSNASLAFALGYVLFFFLILAVMYGLRVFLKV